MDEKERRLVEMVLSGQTEAFEPLVSPYRQVLFALAFRLTGNEEDAREAGQEALMRAFRYLRSFDPARSFRNWILGILVNACRRAASARGAAARLEDGPEAVEPAPGPAARFQAREFRSRLMDCLSVLSRREREAFLLRDIEERDVRETAAILGCSSISVRVHLSAARKKVKDEMMKRYPGSARGVR
jgi:RNA polymerase sigma factor (sigma-70 family)